MGRKLWWCLPLLLQVPFCRVWRNFCSCSQLHINCLAILLFIETCSKGHLRQLHSIFYIMILFFLPVFFFFLPVYLSFLCLFFLMCLIVLQCDWIVLGPILNRVHKWLRYCSHITWLMQQFLLHLLWPGFYPLLPLQHAFWNHPGNSLSRDNT